MSAGSWDYAFHHVENLALKLLREKKPERKVLGKLLLKMAKAAHAIELADGGDREEGSEVDAILDCLPKGAVLQQLLEDAKEIRDQLDKEIKILLSARID